MQILANFYTILYWKIRVSFNSLELQFTLTEDYITNNLGVDLLSPIHEIQHAYEIEKHGNIHIKFQFVPLDQRSK